MATYGTIYTYWSQDWDGNDIVAIAKKVAKAGLTGMEMHASELNGWSKQKQLDYKKLTDDLGLTVVYATGVHESEGLSYYSDDPKVREASIEQMKRNLEWCAMMGASGNVINTSLHSAWPAKPLAPVADKEPYFEKIADCLKSITKTAQDLDVRIATEISNRFEGFIITTVAEMRHIMDLVGSEYLGITFDNFHMNIEEDSIEESVRMAGDKIFHVHLGEANRKLPGQGKMIDWDLFFGELKNTGYDRMLMVEPFVIHTGTVAYSTFLWRDLTGGADEEEMTRQLQESIAFIKGKYEGR